MKITLIIVGIILMITLIVWGYYGGFKKVTCHIEKQGGEILVYRQMTGDYTQSAKLMDEIYHSLLNKYKIETFKGFGIYYDNPKEVEKSELRSEIGCIIEEKDSSKLTQIQNDFEVKTLPKKTYIIAEFPSKGKLSILFGLMKVYPAIEKFVKENHYKQEGFVMEIYDVPNKKIVYRKEIIE